MADILFRATWNNPQQGAANCKAAFLPWVGEQLKSGRRLVIEARLYEDDKTDRQRRYYHGVVLKTIAAQASGADGQRFPLAVWKEYFRAEYLGHKTITSKNPLTGKKHRRRARVSTEDLGVKGYSQLIDRVTAFASTELGVTFASTFEQWAAMDIDPDTGEIMGAPC